MVGDSISLTEDYLRKFGIGTIVSSYSSQQPPPQETVTENESANSLCFSKSGRWLISSHNNALINVIDGETGWKRSEFHLKIHGCLHLAPTHHDLTVLHAAMTAPGNPCAVAYHNLQENKVIKYFSKHSNQVTSISMHPTEDLFITSGLDEQFLIWDLRVANPVASGKFIGTSTVGFRHDSLHSGVAFAPNGKTFTLATPNRGLSQYDLTALKVDDFKRHAEPLRTLEIPLGTSSEGRRKSADTPSYSSLFSMNDIKYSPNGQYLAISTTSYGIFVVDSEKIDEELWVLDKHPFVPNYTCTISFSPDSEFLSVGGCDGHVWCYSLKMGHGRVPVNRFPEPFVLGEDTKTQTALDSAKNSVANLRREMYQLMSQPSRPISQFQTPVSKGVAQNIHVPLAQTEEEMVSRHESPVSAVCWHPTLAVFASADHNVHVWKSTEVPATRSRAMLDDSAW